MLGYVPTTEASRELNVCEDNIDVIMPNSRQRNGIFSGAGFYHLPSGITQRLDDHFPHQPLVFDNENHP